MSLLDLPLDLLYEIASHLHDHDLNTLLRTCSPLYTVFDSELHRRDARREQSRALFWAVQNNQDKILRKTLEAGARAPWATLLLLAVENDAVLAMKVLVEQDGVDINMVEQFEGIPLLEKAVFKRSAKMVRFLLTRNELDPNIKDDRGRTPLAYAAWRPSNDTVKILLKSRHVDVNCTDNQGRTPLHLAAGESNMYVVKTLLADPYVDVTVRDNVHHRTALSAAVESLRGKLAWKPSKVKLRHRRTIEALLEHPATSVNYDTDPDLVEMYRLSAQYGYEEIFKLLWSKGVGQLPGELDHSGILFFLAKHDQGEIMEWLFANGVEPEAQTEKGRTTLSVVAEHKQIEIIRLLLATGKVDVNSKDQDGGTPLWWAMTHGWGYRADQTIKLLLEHGATIPIIEEKKAVLKALYKALEYGNCFLSGILFDQLDKHKPINGTTKRLLLSAVAKSGHMSLAKTVSERARIDLNARNSYNRTILDQAIFYHDLRLVCLLLDLDGIDLNSRDSNGDTALAIAMKELSKSSLGSKQRQFYSTCVDKLLRHKDVTTASLDLYWLLDFIIAQLDDGRSQVLIKLLGRDQELMKLLIHKDDRLVSDTVVHEVDADTLLEWAQQNQLKTIVRVLKEKESES